MGWIFLLGDSRQKKRHPQTKRRQTLGKATGRSVWSRTIVCALKQERLHVQRLLCVHSVERFWDRGYWVVVVPQVEARGMEVQKPMPMASTAITIKFA